jgi:hemoglobin/transferrin/lactoferrin receptor protein
MRQHLAMKNIFLLIFMTVALDAFAQIAVDTTLEAVPVRETVISASRSSQARNAVAQQVKILTRKEIENQNAQSTADLLQNSGAAFVQKSQQGGGSPVLRGFEASRVLLVVDGVRMNNAIYRSGHLQNIITTDNATLERAEVIFGPASTMYGSDALGGAICFYTKNPVFAGEGHGFKTGGSAFFRYGSVNGEKTAHADISLGGRKIAAITSFTVSDFGDLRMGKKRGLAPFFGLREYYVDRIDGQDVLVRNEDPCVQKYSGYKQYDFLEKIVFRPREGVSHTLNLQYSTSSDIPRYDRLTDPGADGLASAEWYYGPQKRLMAAYRFDRASLGWFNGGLHITASYQDIEESRHNRNFGAPRRTDRIEQVGVVGLIADVRKNWDSQNLQLGIDAQYNDVASTASRYNVNTGEVTTQSTRYPDGGSTMTFAAIYVAHNWQPAGNSAWTFSEGVRAGFAGLDATFVSKVFFPFPYDKAEQSSPVVSGTLGAVWNSAAGWRLALSAATGFRVPNVDDLGKVFDSQPGSVVVPNPDLKPEKTLNLDINLTRSINDRLRWENVVWFTALRDAIVLRAFRFNGQDSIDYDGALSRVLANQNAREASLWGFNTGIEADPYDNFAVFASLNYTHGRVRNDEGADTPLDHVPPLYGRIGGRWHTPRASAEVFALFNGKKKLEDYNLEGEDNLQYAPADGMPAWYTVNLRGSVRFLSRLSLQAGIDNIFDVQYRAFASGINGPGRNFWITLRTNW